MKNTRLVGHSLWSEGAGRDQYGDPTRHEGHGFCSCGERSPLLPSNRKRQEWHREHKDSLR